MPALMPVFKVVWNQEPESFPFRQPVDPKALGIPVSMSLSGVYSCKNFEWYGWAGGGGGRG